MHGAGAMPALFFRSKDSWHKNHMHRRNIFTLIGWMCALLTLAAPVATSAQALGKWTFSVAGSMQNYDYREIGDNGNLLNQETGSIPGVALSIDYAVDQWHIVGDIIHHRGGVTYVGKTNNGIPITTRTEQSLTQVAMRAEYWPANVTAVDHALYFGLGFHDQDRDIKPTQTSIGAPVLGLFETYQWWLGFGGAKLVIYKSDRVNWQLDARLTRTVKPTVTIDFNGRFDNTRLDLGERWGVRLELPWKYALSRNTEMTVVPFVEKQSLGRSSTEALTSRGIPVGSVNEPRSESRNFGIQIGVSQRF